MYRRPAHPCGAPNNKGKPCGILVADSRGREARCSYHGGTRVPRQVEPTPEYLPDYALAQVINALAAPMFTWRMAAAQAGRDDAQGARMRTQQMRAEQAIFDILKDFAVGAADARPEPEVDVERVRNSNVGVGPDGQRWVRLEAAQAMAARHGRDAAAAALEKAAAAAPMPVITPEWLTRRAENIRRIGLRRG